MRSLSVEAYYRIFLIPVSDKVGIILVNDAGLALFD